MCISSLAIFSCSLCLPGFSHNFPLHSRLHHALAMILFFSPSSLPQSLSVSLPHSQYNFILILNSSTPFTTLLLVFEDYIYKVFVWRIIFLNSFHCSSHEIFLSMSNHIYLIKNITYQEGKRRSIMITSGFFLKLNLSSFNIIRNKISSICLPSSC